MPILMSTWTVLKDLVKKKLSDKNCFDSSVKDGTTGDNAEKLDRHISNEDYLTGKKIWNKFNMKNMGDCHNRYFKKKNDLLLADVFEKFIDTCLKFCKLDLCQYFSCSFSIVLLG